VTALAPAHRIHPSTHLWLGMRHPSIRYAEPVDETGQSGADDGPTRSKLVELSVIKPHATVSSG
jgi:hypothetical protein